jgi:CPA1 family monovalent cation:H+ antiporter
MRGVIALAAAISLPEVLSNGAAFPQRELMIFLTFCVIFVTLVLQGLTLPPLIRYLGMARVIGGNPEEEKARRAMVEAALTYLEHARDEDQPEFAPVYDELIHFERHRLNLFSDSASQETRHRPEDYKRFRDLSRLVRAVQRAAILNLRNENEINDEVMRKFEHELDSAEGRFEISDDS